MKYEIFNYIGNITDKLTLSVILPIHHTRFIKIPVITAIPKLSKVPTKTYSLCFASSKRRIDFAVIINPKAVNWPSKTKAKAI